MKEKGWDQIIKNKNKIDNIYIIFIIIFYGK